MSVKDPDSDFLLLGINRQDFLRVIDAGRGTVIARSSRRHKIKATTETKYKRSDLVP